MFGYLGTCFLVLSNSDAPMSKRFWLFGWVVGVDLGLVLCVCAWGRGVLEVHRQIGLHALKIALHVVGVSVVHVKTFVQVYYFSCKLMDWDSLRV